MEKKKPSRRWIWYFTLLGALIVLYKLFDNFGQVLGAVNFVIGILTPFVVGLIISLLLHRPSLWIERKILRLKGRLWKKAARPLSLAIVYFTLLGILALLISLVLPRLATSLADLVKAMPGYIDVAGERLTELVQSGPFQQLELAERLDDLYRNLTVTVTQLLSAENVLTALHGVVTVTTSIVDVVIGLIVSVYMLSGRERLVHEVKEILGLFMKKKRVDVFADYGSRMVTIVYNYFYGALLDALVVGVVVSIGLAIFGVPYAVLLGLMLGLLNMIPYFGAIIGGVGIVLITLLTNNIYAAIGVAIYIVVVQQVDANVLQPRVVGGSVGLRPIYVLLAITLFGGLFGFWGIFLGVPLMAIVQMFVKDALARNRKKEALKTDIMK